MRHSFFVSSAVLATAIIVGIGCNQNQQPGARATGKLEELFLAQSASDHIKPIGTLDVVAVVQSPMPTGIAVSKSGRVFVCFPRWGDPVEFTVGEVKNGKVEPYPNVPINQLGVGRDDDTFISVQSVAIDSMDRLWVLDAASISMQQVKTEQPKLVCIDINTDKVLQTIHFPPTVVFPTTYLNDVRFDLTRGNGGLAFISDSSDQGPNGIIVVDLDTGKSWRKLNDHPSTKADESFEPTVESQALLLRPADGKPARSLKVGIDGIAIDRRKDVLYYCPLNSRRLHAVSLRALADPDLPDDEVARTIQELPARDFASDGLHCDRDGNLYLTDYEHNSIRRLANDGFGRYVTVVADRRMIWPDSIAMRDDGLLYFTVNQLNRQPKFHRGQDLRQPPFVIFRAKIGGQSMAMR